MKKKALIIFLNVLITGSISAQFIDSVRVVFEKKINVHKVYEKNEWLKIRIKHTEKYQTELYEFIGNESRSIYRYYQEKENEAVPGSFIMGYNVFDNLVFQNYENRTANIFKVIYEDKVLISDSMRKFKWKITNETRDIAGYKCRKATTIIFDSLMVYAFYAQEIKVTGGPETFNGLPGMILGVAVPQMYTTWFAKSVDTANIARYKIEAPAKGKKNTYQSVFQKISDALKDWGNDYRNLIIWFNLI